MPLAATSLEVQGIDAGGAAPSSPPVLWAGSDGSAVRTIRTDAAGNVLLALTAADTTAGGTLGALSANVSVALTGQSCVAMQLAAGTLVGSLRCEYSCDGGTTWQPTTFYNSVTERRFVRLTYVGGTNAADWWAIYVPSGSSHARVYVELYTSGTANVTLRATAMDLGRLPVRFSYSASSAAWNVANTPTDVWVIAGSATRVVRVTRIEVTGTKSATTAMDVLLIKRSTANSAAVGSSNRHDWNNEFGLSSAGVYVANPTLGTSVATLRAVKLLVPLTLSAPVALSWTFGEDNRTEPITLRGTNEVLAVNFNGQTVLTDSFSFTCEFTEERI